MPLPVPVFDRNKAVTLYAIIFNILLIGAGLWLVYTLRQLIPPFLIALTIALTLAPEIDRMERQGWKRGPAILVIYALFIALFVCFMIVLVPFVSGQLAVVAQHIVPTSLLADQGSAQQHLVNVTSRFMRLHHVPELVRGPIIVEAQQIPTHLSVYLSNLSTELPTFAGSLIWVIVVPILAFYFLADYHMIMGKTLLFIQPERRAEMLRIVNEVVAVFGNYIRGVVLMMVLDIVVTYITLRLMRVPYAETVAVLAGIMYAVPYLGAIISTLLIGLIAFQAAGLAKAALVLGVMVLIHQIIFDQIVAPRIIGKQVGLHPLWAITAMLIGGTLLGVGGTLLAIPLAAGVQVVLVHLYPRLQDDGVAELSEQYLEESDKASEREKETGVVARTRIGQLMGAGHRTRRTKAVAADSEPSEH